MADWILNVLCRDIDRDIHDVADQQAGIRERVAEIERALNRLTLERAAA
jgi:hypothetical protein